MAPPVLCLASDFCRTWQTGGEEKFQDFATSKMTTITINSPRFVHVFLQRKIATPASKSGRFPSKKRNQSRKNPKLTTNHHKCRRVILFTEKWYDLTY